MNLYHNSLVRCHPNVRCLAGDNDHEDPIPAHKIVMGANSDYLKELCYDDDEEEEPIITLYGMNHEALEVFIEFMYVNSINSEKLKKHTRSLYRAADTYKMPLFRELCRNQLISSLNVKNALDIFELSKDDPPGEKTLHEEARCCVINHMKVIAFTQEFSSFVERNPTLTVELIRVLAPPGVNGKYLTRKSSVLW